MKRVSLVVMAGVGVLALLSGCSFDNNGLPGVMGGAAGATGDASSFELLPNGGGGVSGSGGAGNRTGGTSGAGMGGVVGAGGSGAGGVVPGSGGTGAGGASGEPDAKVDLPNQPDLPSTGLGVGATCAAANDCASGFCTDGVCCETACSGTCMACVRSKTGQIDGQCRNVTMASDPDNECDVDADACGRTGRCGMGACELAAANKSCGDSTCNGTQFTAVPRCNGMGKCIASAPTTCPNNFTCKNRVCTTACATNTDCAPGFDCDLSDGKCKVLLASGATCNASLGGKDCKSGHCIDGVCCDTACTGTCNACTQAKTGQRNGLCAPVRAGTDPDEECLAEAPTSCGKTGVCDGQSACRVYPDGTSCGTGCCSGGGNRDGVCSYVCRAGRCDRNNPVEQDTCGVFNCCCPNGNGQAVAACTFPSNCPGGCAQ
ncbi:MAG TPA: hypothetical protein VGF45_09770 [Polyangia bacterium]